MGTIILKPKAIYLYFNKQSIFTSSLLMCLYTHTYYLQIMAHYLKIVFYSFSFTIFQQTNVWKKSYITYYDLYLTLWANILYKGLFFLKNCKFRLIDAHHYQIRSTACSNLPIPYTKYICITYFRRWSTTADRWKNSASHNETNGRELMFLPR
jgi:hypothetical protein